MGGALITQLNKAESIPDEPDLVSTSGGRKSRHDNIN